jgi:hypothetical protein
MLVQDTLTGYFHEVPDGQLYETGYGEYPDQIGEGQVLFDGLGNPVGFLPFIPKIASLATSVLPGLIRGAAPAVRGLVGQLPGMVRGLVGGQGGVPAMPGMPAAMPPFPLPAPRPPWPAGWIRPQLPYTGFGPRRLYMRCAVWPGPRGLVPASAAQAQAAPVAPLPPAAAAQQAAMARVGRRRFRRRR